MLRFENIIKYTSVMNLLYVEDDIELRDVTLSFFKEFFKNIFVAENGLDGLEKFNDNSIDIIITDIDMPKISGLQMIKKIRDIDVNVPILVLSVYDKSSHFLESIEYGVEGYLLKPIDVDQFLNILKKIIQKYKLQMDVDNTLHMLQQYQDATDKLSIVSKTDLTGKITYVNDAFCKTSGYKEEELIGKHHNIIRHPSNPQSMFNEIWQTIKEKKSTWQGIVRNRDKNGESYYVKAMIKPILDRDGKIIEYIALRDDITDIMSPKKQLQDFVGSNKESIVVLLKIDGFYDIEKFYGSVVAKKIEDAFSKKILKLMPKECGFSKVFILDNGEYSFAKNRVDCALEIENLINHLKNFQEIVNDTNLDVGDIDYDASVVISFAYGKDALINATYGLKKIFDNKQDFIIANNLIQIEHKEAKKNLETLKMVKKAIKSSKIISYFQPIIDNETKELIKYESLVRLINEEGEVLSPYFFLDTAKNGKYYSQITAIVLENSFKALTQTDKDISINISILDIEKRTTRMKIYELLEIHKADLHRVVFELLEDEKVKDFKLIRSFLSDVKSKGVKIAIDDFGAGYSNFTRLLDYQPDILKIDGSLIKDIENDKFSLDVVETIVTFAKKQNMQTIAEYVENQNIFNILKNIGVDYSQGYYFGKAEAL